MTPAFTNFDSTDLELVVGESSGYWYTAPGAWERLFICRVYSSPSLPSPSPLLPPFPFHISSFPPFSILSFINRPPTSCFLPSHSFPPFTFSPVSSPLHYLSIRSRPLKARCPGEHCKSNLVRFCFKICHLVAAIYSNKNKIQ